MGEYTFGIVSITVIIILFIYAFSGSFFEAKHFHIIHETGLGIILGILAGGLFSVAFPEQLQTLTSFNESMFFYILLPMIIFSGGYNLNKSRFFQNFYYIVLYGIIGTVLSFIFLTLLSQLVNKLGWIRLQEHFDQPINLSIYNIMMFAATMCASDAVAALTMIKPDSYPKLYSVVFGEGMINDAVSIIIFMSVKNLTNATGTELVFYWYTPFTLIGQFFYEFICSLLIGAFFGFFTTFLFKTFRFILHNVVVETLLVLFMGYLSFSVCYIIDLSGVLSALVASIIMAHYNFYNMSPMGKVCSQVTIQGISQLCESFIYVYLGVSVWTLKDINITTITNQFGDVIYYVCTENCLSWSFVIAQVIIAFVARFLMIAIMSLLPIAITGIKKWRLSFYEINIIWFAGLIRGSVAYALIQGLEIEFTKNVSSFQDFQELQNAKQSAAIVKSTILLLVILSTVILGALMPLFIKVNISAQERAEANKDPNRQSLQVVGESEQSRKYKSRFQVWFKRIDEKIIKTNFIYQYEARKKEIMKSKKLLKMNNTEFDPTQFGRLTVMQQSGYKSGYKSGINPFKSGVSQQVPGDRKRSMNQSFQQYLGMQEGQMNEPIMTKVQIKSSFHTIFGGNQGLNIEFDVPVIIPDGDDENDENDEDEESEYPEDDQLLENKQLEKEMSKSVSINSQEEQK